MVEESITQRIAADIREQIENGTLGPRALLPSEPEVAKSSESADRQPAPASRSSNTKGS